MCKSRREEWVGGWERDWGEQETQSESIPLVNASTNKDQEEEEEEEEEEGKKKRKGWGD